MGFIQISCSVCMVSHPLTDVQQNSFSLSLADSATPWHTLYTVQCTLYTVQCTYSEIVNMGLDTVASE